MSNMEIMSRDSCQIRYLTADAAPFRRLADDLSLRDASNPLRKLSIDGYSSEGEPDWQDSPDVELFFESLVGQNLDYLLLENLGMYLSEERGGMFPVRLVTHSLRCRNRSNLKSVELRDLNLQGTNEDWDEFLEALSGLTSLEVFVVETVSFWVDHLRSYFADLDSLLPKIVGNSSNLRELTLVPCREDRGPNWEPITRTLLFRSPSLRTLWLSLHGNTDSFTSLLDTLYAESENTRLAFLCLSGCQTNTTSIRALGRFLLGPNTSLQTIRIIPTDGSFGGNLKEEMTLQLLDCLAHNMTVRYFHFTAIIRPPSTAVIDAYKGMMQRNCTLLDMRLFSPISKIEDLPHDTMKFYARLNELGRREYLEQSHLLTKEKWIDVLSTSDDLSCLFYFLRLNPLLCY